MDVELKIPRSITCVYPRPVTDEDHVCQLAGGAGTFDVPGAEIATQLQRSCQVLSRDVITKVLHHDYQASLRSAISISTISSIIGKRNMLT